MPATPIWSMTAVEIARLIRRGELSSREVIDSFLERADAVNPAVNALGSILRDDARAAAARADRDLASGAQVGPLHGVPVTVKENIDLAGCATTMGLPAFTGAVVERDAPHIEHLRAAGAIPLARTNLPDLAFRWHTDSSLHGPTVNPWDEALSPGGSSGGDAVAVATGMTPLGIGNDYFGSLRVPAQFCGISALRPTAGRIPSASSLLADPPISMQLMAVQGPMARSVADLRLALEVMGRPHPRDPFSASAPDALGAPVRRVGVHREGAGGSIGDIDRAAEALLDAGYQVEEVTVPLLQEGSDLAQDLVAADSTVLVDQLRGAVGADSLTFIDAWLGLRPPLPAAELGEALTARHRIARAWSELQATYPLVLGPVSTRPPFAVGTDLGGGGAVQEIFDSLRLVVVVALLGLPAVAVSTNNGGPGAVQIIGPRLGDLACLDASAAVEERLGTPPPIEPVP